VVWEPPWVVWARQAAPVPRPGANPHLLALSQAAVGKVAQAAPQRVDKRAAQVARRAALRPDRHRALVDLGAHNKQVVPAHRVADPAVLRAVALAVLADKAAQVDWPWPHLAATTKCAVVSYPEPGRPLRVQLVSAVAHS
jgi:hypothetical protein